VHISRSNTQLHGLLHFQRLRRSQLATCSKVSPALYTWSYPSNSHTQLHLQPQPHDTTEATCCNPEPKPHAVQPHPQSRARVIQRQKRSAQHSHTLWTSSAKHGDCGPAEIFACCTTFKRVIVVLSTEHRSTACLKRALCRSFLSRKECTCF
jgi:hypothetical protein